jgi:NAD(P)-dependent dehydrogenase (short-subunit alcohol dehydrogenase family)
MDEYYQCIKRFYGAYKVRDILNGKVAVVYGAGAIGGAVASAFAEAGAKVYLADQNEAKAKTHESDAIRAAKVDALNQEEVEAFTETVFKNEGRIDISFCVTSTHKPGGEQGAALSELSYEDFSMPLMDYTKSQFYTANAAATYMKSQGSGVIMAITAVPSQIPYPYTAGFGPAWAAVECMLRLMAAELGTSGIRTVCLHSAGSAEAQDSIAKTLAANTKELGERAEGWSQRSASRNLLGKSPTLKEVGDMAAFMASDLAGATTGTTISLDEGMINH